MLPLIFLTALAASGEAQPVADLGARASCPEIHIFGARGTTEPPGYGASKTVVDDILNAYPGSTSEPISYPACGGGSYCGGDSYSQSVAAGVAAVVSQVGAFRQQCPNTKIVVVGYSQGGEIFDVALCGGGDPHQGIQSTGSIASYNITAGIFMGDPRWNVGAPYEVGTCTAGGFDARPQGQYCGAYNTKVQSYCDAGDPYCCNGHDAAVHGSYNQVYGQAALKFVESKLNAQSGSASTSPCKM